MIEQPRNYYEFLGIAPDAGVDEIKKAYIALARQYHPDHNDDPEDRRMIELNHIWEILSDPERKREYDERFVPGTVYDFSKPAKQDKTGPVAADRHKTVVLKERYSNLRTLRIGLTSLLLLCIAYLVFFLVVNILHMTVGAPGWLLKLVPH